MRIFVFICFFPAALISAEPLQLQVPKGYEIELVAGPPLIERPVVADLDDQGRLYVAESSGSNEPPTKQLETKTHRIVRLEDTNNDGIYDKRVVFAEGLSFLQGVMWLNGSLYVGAPPRIWKLTDTNNDGLADQREVWFDGKTLTGCANDLHGPYRGIDGWIYWTKGAFAQQEYRLNEGQTFSSRASHIFRAKPDGKSLEAVMTGGMDNPVDVVFTEDGERFCSCTFLQHPGNGKRDGIIHPMIGGIFGKDHDVVSFKAHRRTRPDFMPIMTHLGPAAPSGLHRYQGNHLGKDYQDNLFCAQFNMRKVSRHQLQPNGSTYQTIDSDFVTSDNLDFHPTDVLEDGQGHLLVIDTGGWYKLCCPTSQLLKPDILGGIYRVRKIGSKSFEDPYGAKIDWKSLSAEEKVKLLVDKRSFVRQLAADRLAKEAVSPALIQALNSENTSLAIAAHWLVYRVNSSQLLPGMLLDRPNDLLLDRVQLQILSLILAELPTDLREYDPIIQQLLPRLQHSFKLPDDRNVRLAIECLGRTGHRRPSILLKSALEKKDLDAELTHAAIYCMLRCKDDSDIPSLSPRLRQIAMVAKHHLQQQAMKSNNTISELNSQDAELGETAWWILAQHPEWHEKWLPQLQQQLLSMDEPTRKSWLQRLETLTDSPAIQKWVVDCLEIAELRSFAFQMMQTNKVNGLPVIWRETIEGQFATVPPTEQAILLQILLAKAQKKDLADSLQKQLFTFALSDQNPPDRRLQALKLIRKAWNQEQPELWQLVRKSFSESTLRPLVIDLLISIPLTDKQCFEVAEWLPDCNLVEFSKLLECFNKTTSAEVGMQFVRILQSPKRVASLRRETIEPILKRYPVAVQMEATKLYSQIAALQKGQQEKLDQLLQEVKNGDIRRGQVLFASTKAACITCHQMGYKGGKAGPDLTRIGSIRSERDLLEAIVYPSASFVRSYEPYRVNLQSGQSYNGLLKQDGPDIVILQIAADQELRIPHKDIEELSPSSLSIMPAGFDQQLTPQELADLVQFLKASK